MPVVMEAVDRDREPVSGEADGDMPPKAPRAPRNERHAPAHSVATRIGRKAGTPTRQYAPSGTCVTWLPPGPNHCGPFLARVPIVRTPVG